MKIVNRTRLGVLCILAVGHLLATLLFVGEKADLIIVLFGLNATLFFVAAPLLVDLFFLRDMHALNAFVDEVKKGRFDAELPVRSQPMHEEDEGEFMRLRRSLNWMVRQIEVREKSITEEIERVRLLNAELERQSVTDPMTGLFNYGYFWSEISKSVSTFQREGRPFSLVVADIDYFKKVNDTYGHPAGDAVLKGVAVVLQEHVRDTDVLARIGGEEFGIILNHPSSVDAPSLLQRLQENIRQAAFPLDDGRCLRVTMSMGFVTIATRSAVSAEDMVKRADDALYFVKRNGRNSVVDWSEIQHP